MATEPYGFDPAGDDWLAVQVDGTPGEPDRLLEIGRPADGIVRVREHRYGTSESEPRVYDAIAADLLGALETLAAGRRRMNRSVHELRGWLAG